MLIKLYDKNPDERQLQKVVDCLQKGGIVIYPTDTVYAIGCSIEHAKLIDKISQIKGRKKESANYALICADLSHLSNYCKPINNTVFKLMKRVLPGPYTFILEANNQVPKIMFSKKQTIGIRITAKPLLQVIVERLGVPLITTSLPFDPEEWEQSTDPELIYEEYQKQVDMVVDGDVGGTEFSTVIDCTGDDIVVVREGKGIVDWE